MRAWQHSNHASGVKTNCDTYVYSFSRDALEEKILNLIDAYNEALDDVECDLLTVQAATQNTQLEAIKWTDTLKTSLKQGKKIEFEPRRIREVLYRPFTKLWLYEDDRILSSVSTVSKMFPRDEEVEAVGFTGGSGRGTTDSVFATDALSDLNNLRGGGAGLLPDGDPHNQRQQHDFPGTRDEPADGSSSHQGFSTNQGDPQSDITRGGGQSKQFSSQPHPTKQSSEFSRPEPSGISAQPEPNKPAEPSPESDPPDGPVQHGDLRHSSHHPASRPTLHGSRPTNPNPPQSDITRGGGQKHTIQSDDPHHARHPTPLLNLRDPDSPRPPHHRPPDPQPPPNPKTRPAHRRHNILINQTQQLPFTTLATNILFDLCATGRQTRTIPKQPNPQPEPQ